MLLIFSSKHLNWYSCNATAYSIVLFCIISNLNREAKKLKGGVN